MQFLVKIIIELLRLTGSIVMLLLYIIPLLIIGLIAVFCKAFTNEDLTNTKPVQKFIFPLVWYERNFYPGKNKASKKNLNIL